MIAYVRTHKLSLLLTLFCVLFYSAFAYDLVRNDFLKLISLYSAIFFFTFKIIQLNKGYFWYLAAIGILFRAIFIVALPNLSQDFYRFLWDGRLVIQGINPYLFTPESYLGESTLSSIGITIPQAQELYDGMGSLNGSHFSNYPPLNQFLFAIAAFFTGKSILGSTMVLSVIVILADIGVLYFGKKLLKNMGVDIRQIFWYFLNPFIIIELTGNLHFEGVMLFFLVWSLYLLQQRKWFWSAVLLGLSISIKLLPLMLLPIFYQWFISKELFFKGVQRLVLFYLIVIGTFLLSFLPFYSNEITANYMNTIRLWFQDFEFNASVYYIIRWVGYKIIGWNTIETVGKILPVLVFLFIMIISFFRKNNDLRSLITAMLLGLSFYFLLATTVHPWYVATPLLLAVFSNYRFPIIWSFMVMLSYSAYGIDGFYENHWFVALEYTVVIVFFLWESKYPKKSLAFN